MQALINDYRNLAKATNVEYVTCLWDGFPHIFVRATRNIKAGGVHELDSDSQCISVRRGAANRLR